MPSIPRRARAAIVSVFILYVLWEFIQNTTSTARDIPSTVPWHEAQSSQHPFDRLISHAQDYQKALGLDTPSLSAASDAYRKRRGRHPPPGFDKWHTRAVAKEAFITESFFDQIYEDLEPFWGTNPTKIEEASRGWEWTIRVRSGKVIVPKGRFRAKVWGEMIRQLSSDLPDMNILINPLDEARVVMPYHAMEPLIAKASDQKQKMMSLPRDSISARKARPIVDGADSPSNILWTISGPYWSLLRQTCAPAVDGEVSTTATANQIGNWTAMKNICENRHWRNLHGGLIQPQTLSVTTSLVPIFSDAKLHGNNDILLPPPSYYTDDAMFSGSSWLGDGRDKISWHRKTHGLIWRGKATGGRSTKSTWQSFQRHRFVSMLNSSQIRSHLTGDSPVRPEFPTTEGEAHASLTTWLDTTADAAFTNLLCAQTDGENTCQEIAQYYSTAQSKPMKKQYRWKYLPDIDGNSLSGRFRAFLLSNSAPMKATIFKEWHDNRLTPWIHFIPINITMQDLWVKMAYFLGYPGVDAHDEAGKRIALEGQAWAKKVLRKEDMLLYMYRLLLEYARICDPDRDALGYIE